VQRRDIQIDGARVAVWGTGPAGAEPVLLLHGYPSNHMVWRHQIETLSREHRVVAPDLLAGASRSAASTCHSTTRARSSGSA
jgi:cis-3-alkyl-4-acyloxetan-2-one decarboxylase